jgi:hypothetical protein
MDLFVYNFCTGKSLLVAQNAYGLTSFSTTGWIAFMSGKDGYIYKVKPNGDSLTKLIYNNHTQSVSWSPDGRRFLMGYKYIVDATTLRKDSIPHCGKFLGWYDDETIIHKQQNQQNITKTNVLTKEQTFYFEEPSGLNLVHYDKSKKIFIGSELDSTYKVMYFLWADGIRTNLLDSFQGRAFAKNMYGWVGDKILMQQLAQDTVAGASGNINFRSHIAIMDADGKNLRQVIFNE